MTAQGTAAVETPRPRRPTRAPPRALHRPPTPAAETAAQAAKLPPPATRLAQATPVSPCILLAPLSTTAVADLCLHPRRRQRRGRDVADRAHRRGRGARGGRGGRGLRLRARALAGPEDLARERDRLLPIRPSHPAVATATSHRVPSAGNASMKASITTVGGFSAGDA